MRHTFGGTWLFQLMILFIFLFAGYIILTINYSKSIKIKNEVVSMVEKYGGLNDSSLSLVNTYLKTTGYDVTGVCTTKDTTGVYGAVSLDSNSLEEARAGAKYYYCLKKYRGINTSNYYQVTVFYRFNLPVVGDASRFSIKGSTSNFQANDLPEYCYAVDGTCRSSGGASSGGGSNGGGSKPENTVIVTFNGNGATYNIPSQTISSGGRISKPNDPVREGYVFNGWKVNGQFYDFNSVVTSNLSLEADWRVNGSGGGINENNPTNTYTVKFDLNGSSGETYGDQVLKYGDVASTVGEPRWNNCYGGECEYKFSGWYQNGHKYDFSTPITSDITLQARWEKRIFVSVDASGVGARLCLPNAGGSGKIETSCQNTTGYTANFYVDNNYSLNNKVSFGSLIDDAANLEINKASDRLKKPIFGETSKVGTLIPLEQHVWEIYITDNSGQTKYINDVSGAINFGDARSVVIRLR